MPDPEPRTAGPHQPTITDGSYSSPDASGDPITIRVDPTTVDHRPTPDDDAGRPVGEPPDDYELEPDDTDTDPDDPVRLRAGMSPGGVMTTLGSLDDALAGEHDGFLVPVSIASPDFQLACDGVSRALNSPEKSSVIRYVEAPVHIELTLTREEAEDLRDGLEDFRDDHDDTEPEDTEDAGDPDPDPDVIDFYLMEVFLDPGMAERFRDDLLEAATALRRQSGVDMTDGVDDD